MHHILLNLIYVSYYFDYISFSAITNQDV